MIAAVAQRNLLAVPLAATVTAGVGALCAVKPGFAVVLVGLAALALFTFQFPVAHLTTLLVLTAVVPFSVQNAYGGSPGVVVSDVLLVFGLTRAILVLFQRPLGRVRAAALLLGLIFLVLAATQAVHGVLAGHSVSDAGAELRALLGFGTLIVALPLIDEAARRASLFRGLALAGLVLGLAGVAQWILQVPFSGTGDFGVREGVALTSSGRGQVQGGLFAFPVAVILAFAALLSGAVRSMRDRALVVSILGLNAVSLLLTFERTFWLAAVLGCAYVALRAGRLERARAVVLAPLLLVAIIVPMTVVAPETLTTARERLVSIGQYGSDNSVRYRLIESRHVIEQIRDRPWFGSGLGATIFWGRPYEQVPADTYAFVHNGYLWLIWKLGIPTAVLLLAMVSFAIIRKRRAAGGPLLASLSTGSQGALLALAAASMTFPAFTTLSITPVLGTLLAFCVLPGSRIGNTRP